jgi:ABC-type glutathione transport system ATPase component
VAYVREREESDSPGDSLGATPTRPPRRSRRQRSAIERAADAIVAYKAAPAGEDLVVEAVEAPPQALLAVVEAPSPPVLEVMAGAQVLEETVPVAVVAPSPPPPPSTFEGFRELLGQPVGLRLDAVTRSFRMGDVKVEAVKDVSLEIAPGEFVAVVGPSGCGKSTLLGLLGGLDRPTSGHVYAAGGALDQLPEPALADYRLQRVGAIFQTFNLLPSMTAEDNVAMPPACRPPRGVPAPAACSSWSVSAPAPASARAASPAGSSSGSR